MLNLTEKQWELRRRWDPQSFDAAGNYIGAAEKSVREKIPNLDSLKNELGYALGENEYSKTEEDMKSAAAAREETGKSAEEDAARRSAELYDLLLSYGSKQDGRYDDLISKISEGSYRDNAGAQEILAEYRDTADRQAEHSFAAGAAENGGNPDSYAAAQAERNRLAVTKEGEKAARAYYGEQLDRLLAAISASGADMSRLYGNMQNNVDERSGAADDALSLSADLLESLASLQNDRRERDMKLYSSLLEKDASLKGNSVSPMQVDTEYQTLVGESTDDASKAAALIKLWNKYPAMRDYIAEKYETLLKKPYLFQ